jgi:inorganic phosphate transporter, PiT family
MHVGFGLALALAFAFALTNGFHDASNAIATLVATRAAKPLQAVALASVFNVLGPLVLGAAVADTIGGIVTLAPAEAIQLIGAGLAAAVCWNVLTWWRGLPSSSGHALVGGLVGAGLLEGGVDAIRWGGLDGWHPVGVILGASLVGGPVSTTQVVASSVVGAGAGTTCTGRSCATWGWHG